VLFAAGSTVVDEVVDGRRGFFRTRAGTRRLWRSRRWAVGIALVSGVVFLPLALPVLPASAVGAAHLQKVNYNLGEEIGWPDFLREVAGVWHTLPPSARTHAVIVTDNYGEAGAIVQLGHAYGLPTAYSGHNSFWSWGPPPGSANTVVAVGLDRSQLTPFFGSVRLAGRIHNRARVDNDEAGAPIWIATQRRAPWTRIWRSLKHYG